MGAPTNGHKQTNMTAGSVGSSPRPKRKPRKKLVSRFLARIFRKGARDASLASQQEDTSKDHRQRAEGSDDSIHGSSPQELNDLTTPTTSFASSEEKSSKGTYEASLGPITKRFDCGTEDVTFDHGATQKAQINLAPRLLPPKTSSFLDVIPACVDDESRSDSQLNCPELEQIHDSMQAMNKRENSARSVLGTNLSSQILLKTIEPPKPDVDGKGCAAHEVDVAELPVLKSDKDILGLTEGSVPLNIMLGPSDESNAPAKITFVDEMAWAHNRYPENPGYYSGPVIHGDTPHGRGSLLFDSGDTYHGPFKNGQMHGNDGNHTMPRGSVYNGGFYANLRHGHGEHTVGGHPRYIGNYEFGVPHGYGEAYNGDGSLFHKGQWENGIPAHKMIPFRGRQNQQDDGSMASEFIQVAADDPADHVKGSHYSPSGDLSAHLRAQAQDDLSVDSDQGSYFSDLTGGSSLFGSEYQDEFAHEEDRMIQNVGSFLSLDRLTKHAPSEITAPGKELYRSLSDSLSLQKHGKKERLNGDRNIPTSSDTLEPKLLYSEVFTYR